MQIFEDGFNGEGRQQEEHAVLWQRAQSVDDLNTEYSSPHTGHFVLRDIALDCFFKREKEVEFFLAVK